MIKRNSLMRYLMSGLFIGLISQRAGAEEWTDFSWTNTETTMYMKVSTFPKTRGNNTSPASLTASLKATGRSTEEMKDSVRVWWGDFNPELTIRGFTLQVNVNNFGWIAGNSTVAYPPISHETHIAKSIISNYKGLVLTDIAVGNLNNYLNRSAIKHSQYNFVG